MTGSLFEEILGVGGALTGAAIDSCGWLDNVASGIAVNQLVNCTRNRPHPWSTASDYTSWKSLTDRTYQGRWLPAAVPGVQPAADAVKMLFARPPGAQLLSKNSTCLFPAFAQYLTDGFIRTRTDDRSRTTSNHEIDLCQLYGRTEVQTDTLRLKSETPGQKGRLKTQVIGGEDFSPFYYLSDGETVDPQYAEPFLDSILGDHTPGVTPDRRSSLFAIGGDRANSTPFTTMMNTLFLREHNRVAGELEVRNPGWGDEQVFQTARNIMIPMFIKIVVEQYINHISPAPFNLTADPTVAWSAKWNRPNWITAEFSLLYRWHSLMPDVIDWPTGPIPLGIFTMDNRPLMNSGLAAGFAAAAAQPAAELGALNTSAALMIVEELAIDQARSNHLASYNAYRVCFGMKPATSTADITSDRRVAALLEELYPTVDDIEFYPGLFAEDRVARSPLPGLLARIVAVDAFSQALTNPLLSEHVFNAETFTAWGLQLIHDTRSLGQILARQQAGVDPTTITMTQPSWSYWHTP
jgi:prostaglandin-endoperoxide synthase 2